jgi:hypothetical protein
MPMRTIKVRVQSAGLVLTAIAAVLGVGQVASGADLGVPAKKMILLDKAAPTFKSKTVYVAKNDVGIQKGAAGSTELLDATFDWFYETDGASSVFGCFTHIENVDERERWVKNTESVAKFVNKDAAIESDVKVVVVKPTKVAKIVALGLTNAGGNANLFLGSPTASDGLRTVLTINNGNDSSTHRMCTQFATDAGSTVIMKEIAGGTGRKLVAKNGVAVVCPPSPCP